MSPPEVSRLTRAGVGLSAWVRCVSLCPLPNISSSYLLSLMVGEWTETNEKHLVNFTLGVITSNLIPTVVGAGAWVLHHFASPNNAKVGLSLGSWCVIADWYRSIHKGQSVDQQYWPVTGRTRMLGISSLVDLVILRTLCQLPLSFIFSLSLPSWFLSLPQSHSFPQGNGKPEP